MPMPKIYRHKTGRYYMNPTIGGKRHSIYGLTEAEVEEKYIRLMYEYGMGVKVGQRALMSDYLRTWLSRKKDELSPYTYQGYKGNIENHILPFIGNKTVQELVPADIQMIYATKRKERRAVETEQKALETAQKKLVNAKTEKDKATAEALIKSVNQELCKESPLSETSYTWVFSGIGVTVITIIFEFIRRHRKKEKNNSKEQIISMTQKSGHHSTNIQIGGDYNGRE